MASCESDSDETFCEQYETNLDKKLGEIEESIRSHIQRRVFMTKPQMEAYGDVLKEVLSRSRGNKRRLATLLLKQLEQILRIVEEFEALYNSQKSSVEEEKAFSCSLLSNQNFVSQVDTNNEAAIRPPETVAEEISESAVDKIDGTDFLDTRIVQPTETEDTDAKENTEVNLKELKENTEVNLKELVKLIRANKISFLQDLAAIRSRGETVTSFKSTTTSLVSNEFKLSEEAALGNMKTLFEVQKEAMKWCKKGDGNEPSGNSNKD